MLFGKGFSARATQVGLFLVVPPNVRLEIGRKLEHFLANAALVAGDNVTSVGPWFRLELCRF